MASSSRHRKISERDFFPPPLNQQQIEALNAFITLVEDAFIEFQGPAAGISRQVGQVTVEGLVSAIQFARQGRDFVYTRQDHGQIPRQLDLALEVLVNLDITRINGGGTLLTLCDFLASYMLLPQNNYTLRDYSEFVDSYYRRLPFPAL